MINDRSQQGVMRASHSLGIASHTILRNTYMLLAMTLFFSAIMAMVAAVTNAGMIGPWTFLIGVLGLQLLIHLTADSILGILLTFVFTGFIGYAAGPFLNLVVSTLNNGSELIMIAAGGTGFVFFGLSGYVLTTRKDMSFLEGAIIAGTIVALIGTFASILLQIPALQLALCVIFILISSGMIMYQTSMIINSGETNYVIATVTLYLAIYNIFMTLLQLLVSFVGQK